MKLKQIIQKPVPGTKRFHVATSLILTVYGSLSVEQRKTLKMISNSCIMGLPVCFILTLQILASFSSGSYTQLPSSSVCRSTSKEINKRIEHAVDLRSSERMRQEHITPATLVFKDTHIEEKVQGAGCDVICEKKIVLDSRKSLVTNSDMTWSLSRLGL